jgi:CopG-like RHH_1 or ribbon-helix-helix domain, RHH_5
MPSNWRITVTLPEQFKEFLEQWAEDEHRSVSNLAASILINAAQEKISMSELEIQKSKSQTLKKSNPKAKVKSKSADPKQSA